MSIDITQQVARMRSEVKRAEAFLRARRPDVRPRDLAPYEADLMLLRAILATLERVAAEERPEGRRDAIHRLAAFGWACLQEHRQEMADIDGFAAQELALKAGVIEEREVTEPCGDNCVCAEVAGFPTRCYFIAEDCRRAMGTEPA